jgi:hypothetical protein
MNSNLATIAGIDPEEQELEFLRSRHPCAADLYPAVSNLIGKGFRPDEIFAGMTITLVALGQSGRTTVN